MADPRGGLEQPRGMKLLRRLAAIVIRGSAAPCLLAELDDLLDSDLRKGLSPARARRRYLLNATASSWALIRNAGMPRLGISLLDIRLGARMSWKNPGLTAAAVFALAVGIPVGLSPWYLTGITETDLPVPQGDRIRALRYWNPREAQAIGSTVRHFNALTGQLDRLENTAAVRVGRYNVGAAEGGSALVGGAEVTEAAFEILRERAILGRTLSRDDFLAEAPLVAVLGESVWSARFGGDSTVVGQGVWIGGVRHTVVGVMPKGFRFPRTQDFWVPLKSLPGADAEVDRPVVIFGRLAPDASDDSADAQFAAFLSAMALAEPEHYSGLEADLAPFWLAYSPSRKGSVRADPDFFLLILMAFAVLGVACANVGLLLFARTAGRSRELAVRTALGASRSRIITQIIAEAGILAVLAGAVGLLLLNSIPAFVLSLSAPGLTQEVGPISQTFPWWSDFTIGTSTVAWCLLLAVTSAIAAGVIPALRMTSQGVHRNIQRADASRSGSRFGGVTGFLIAADVAIVVAVLGFGSATMGAMVRADLNPGERVIDSEEFLSAQIALLTARPGAAATRDSAEIATARVRRHELLLDRLANEPGVLGVAAADALPRNAHRRGDVELDAGPRADSQANYDVRSARVSPGFFDGLGVDVLMGRGFNSGDLDGEPSVVIINTDMARIAFGNANPLGRRIRYLRNGQEPGPWLDVVGVVPSFGMDGLGFEQEGGIYLPLKAGSLSPLRVAIRTNGDPAEFVPRLRSVLTETDRELGLISALPLDEVREEDWYFLALLTFAGGTLIAVLIALAVSGLYAIMSFAVSERTREIGIRTALGAGDISLALTVAQRSLLQVAAGAALGMPAAWWIFSSIATSGRPALLAALLPGIGVMILITLLACTGPTLRALRIEPTEALRD